MRKKTIGLYFNNFGFSEVDLSRPEKGNPGIGGTLFNFITLPYYFNLHFPGAIEWVLIGPDNNKIPEGIKTIHLESPDDLEGILKEHSFDYFIWKPANTSHFVPLLEKYNQPGIAWCNNVPGPKELQALAESDIIKKVVFAGHEALDLVRDHKVICKSTVIYNGFDPGPYHPEKPVSKVSNHVVYLGSLHPAKCFHLLAQAWPGILKNNPHARLTVIGSGKLYDRSSEMGPFGLSEKSYEKTFTNPLLDETGSIHPSVKFAGLMGKEKIPIMQQASVGVINPHGMSEVCPGSAIEFQACGTPVVAGARFGNLDTIIHKKTGFLVNTQKALINKISYLLRHPDLAEKMGREGIDFIAKKFAQERIVDEWRELFNELHDGLPHKVYPMKKNGLYHFKFVFEILRILKFKLGILKNLPSIYEYIESEKGNET